MSVARKRKIIGPATRTIVPYRGVRGSTDQDSTEKRIRRKTEEEVTSDSEEESDEDICTEIVPGKEQTVSLPLSPSYIKSCSRTQIKSTIVDHTWKIDQFMCLPNITSMIKSPPFPDTGQYMIQIDILRQPDTICVLKFCILTSKTFNGSCTTTIMLQPARTLTSRFITGGISNKTLLLEISTSNFQIHYSDTLIVHCKLEYFHELEHETTRMNLIPSSTVFSKDARYFENLIFDKEPKDEESIKFVVGREQYFVSKKLLWASKSSYFKNICRTHEQGREKNMTKELTSNELQTFKQILLYIITGSVKQCDYDMLKKLLTAADKYDVLALKLTCEHYLLRSLTIENAVELVQLASSCNAKFLEVHSANFIKFHTKEITNTKEC
ncbi:protein roadkill-like isoform X1 [Temnothorax curvispinosus]|uniref:Protein roadkill-like isoform X1 n=2 Tax=Temnothorax curvispinosus TaxID=300111 RepID=A0A6J1PTX7_9HYME|nr:protein roadkill-like isoform X1 [Temnothorax curvispinosus]